MPIKVFISYSWDNDQHKEKVRNFAISLQNENIEIIIDTYYKLTPPGGWIRWMKKSVEESTYVIIICTETYHRRFEGNEEPRVGQGVKWESRLIYADIYQSDDVSKYIPVIFDESNHQYVPSTLDCSRFLIQNNDVTELSDSLLNPIDESLINTISTTSDSTQFEDIKEYLNHNLDIQILRKIAAQYLPSALSKALPTNIDKLIDELNCIGYLPQSNCVPIICTLQELYNKNNEPRIKSCLNYLDSKFTYIANLSCRKTFSFTELTVQVLFSYIHKKHHITIWCNEHDNYNQESFSWKEVDLNNQAELSDFCNSLKQYINEKFEPLYGNKINLEIILPKENIYENIFQIRSIANNILVNQYKIVFRIESRFTQPSQTLLNKWEEVQNNKNALLKDNANIIPNNTYDDEMSNVDTSTILEQPINNHSSFIDDIITYGIPLALSSLNHPLSQEFYDDILTNTTICDCKDDITSYIMRYRKKNKSQLFLIYDNPNKVPEIYKKPQIAMYGN